MPIARTAGTQGRPTTRHGGRSRKPRHRLPASDARTDHCKASDLAGQDGPVDAAGHVRLATGHDLTRFFEGIAERLIWSRIGVPEANALLRCGEGAMQVLKLMIHRGTKSGN